MDIIDKELFNITKEGVSPTTIIVSIPFWMEIQEDEEVYFNKYGDLFYKNLHLHVNPKLKEGFCFK